MTRDLVRESEAGDDGDDGEDDGDEGGEKEEGGGCGVTDRGDDVSDQGGRLTSGRIEIETQHYTVTATEISDL